MLKSFDPSNGEFIGEVPITPVSEIPEMATVAAQVHKVLGEKLPLMSVSII